MMNESLPYSIVTILWESLAKDLSPLRKNISRLRWFLGPFLQWLSVFLVSESGLWVSIGPKSPGPWNRFWDFESSWSSQKARKFRHFQKTSKVGSLYFDPLITISGQQGKVWKFDIWIFGPPPGDRVPKKWFGQFSCHFRRFPGENFLWSKIFLALPVHLVPCWWVGWWLWRAGCISQHTYLHYV